MKVGTDGVLLGAWAPIPKESERILDIGTGTGLIALMLAQRSDAECIDAVEIDDDAFEQAVDNFENSPWGDRLFCFHASLSDLIDEPDELYDVIVSNPPFHPEDYKSRDKSRNSARFSDAMPLSEIAEAAGLMLSDKGIFSLIIPYSQLNEITTLAEAYNLYPCKVTLVKGNPGSPVKRALIAFSRNAGRTPEPDVLIIETSRHQYTPQYISLCGDFYIKMPGAAGGTNL